MSKANRTLVILTACLAMAFTVGVFAAEAPAPAVQPAPATAAAPVPATVANAPDAGQCLPDAVGLPEPLLQKGNQTCDECLAYCEQRELDCQNHCLGLDCGVKCPNQYFKCVDQCPC